MFFHRTATALSLAATLASIVNADCGVDVASVFGPSLSSGAKISLPSDAEYINNVPGRWTVWNQPTFCGSIKPATEADVQSIVRTAKANNVPFLAIASGHGFSEKDNAQKNVLQINLQGLNTINVDTANNLVTVGGGVTNADVIQQLYTVGKEITVGNAACVGFNGVAIGAGIGPLQGLHGLTQDSLVSARLVTASGEVVTVSQTENSDLFWAIRGAGANFGIITSATYKVYDATNAGQAVSANFIFPPAANRSVFEFLHSFDDNLLPSLTVQVAVSYNQTSKSPLILANLVNHGPQADIQIFIDQLAALKPVTTLVSTVPWTTLDKSLFFGVPSAGNCKNDTYNNLYALGLKKTDPSTLESFVDDFSAFSAAHPTYTGTMNIQRYSSAKVLANAASGGVYPSRDINAHVLFSNLYPDSSLDADVNGFMLDARSKLSHTGGYCKCKTHVYINYAHGDEGVDTWYGAQNMDRLLAAKKKWDPTNAFTGGHPIISH